MQRNENNCGKQYKYNGGILECPSTALVAFEDNYLIDSKPLHFHNLLDKFNTFDQLY